MLQGRNGRLETRIIGAIGTIIVPALLQLADGPQETFLGFREIHV
jgi:hypothetical protein